MTDRSDIGPKGWLSVGRAGSALARRPRGAGEREFEGAINVAMMGVPTSDSFVPEREAVEATLTALYRGS